MWLLCGCHRNVQLLSVLFSNQSFWGMFNFLIFMKSNLQCKRNWPIVSWGLTCQFKWNRQEMFASLMNWNIFGILVATLIMANWFWDPFFSKWNLNVLKICLKISLPCSFYTLLKSVRCTRHSTHFWLLTLDIIQGESVLVVFQGKIGQCPISISCNCWYFCIAPSKSCIISKLRVLSFC